jgi:YidC/Oxa1 family membrane protein insertase
MFTTLIVQPIFNLLVLIYALLPGHNFGVAVILFTIIVRLLMWPLIKKQLYNTKVMREVQPELKRIKQETKGDRQRESTMVMELYKERGINPFSSIGILFLQLPILIGLYLGLQRIIKDPNEIITFAYPALQNLSWLKQLASDISQFDMTLLGVVDLKRAAFNESGTYWPAMLLVLGSAVTQFFQSKQLSPDDKDARKLRHILRDAGKGDQADSSEVNAAVMRSTRYFIPVLIFFFTVNLASALALYWFVSGLVAMLQQKYILDKEEDVLETSMHKDDKKPLKKVTSTARVVSIRSETSKTKTTPAKKKASSKKSKKRR